MKTAVVLLYGIYQPEKPDYQNYLDFLAHDFKTRKIERVILCGNFTDTKFPDYSEASAAKEYLQTVYPEFTHYTLEERSLTTNQNLEFAYDYITENDDLIIYCEHIRKAKVIWIALHYLLKLPITEVGKAFVDFIRGRDLYKDFEYKNLVVVGFDFKSKGRDEITAQTYASIVDVLGLYYKEIDEDDVRQRKVDLGLTQ